jgi:hypothetical protein
MAVLTVPNARLSMPLAGVGTAAEFDARIAQVKWFSRLGEPSPWDAGAVRLRAWEEWPGPEEPGVEAFGQAAQGLFDAVMQAAGDREHLQSVFDRAQDQARASAIASRIPCDPDQDAWHGPTQCAWDAGFCAGLIACFIERSLPVPEDLQEQWAWFQSGHWPCGFAGDPAVVGVPLALLVY